MADSVDIYTATEVHQAFLSMEGFGHRDDIADAVFAAAVAARDAALAIPAGNYCDIRKKLQMLIDDAGCGLVEVEGLAFIARDIDVLLGRVQ